MFDGFHYPQVFDSIVAVNTIDVIHLFAVLQRLDKCVSYKSMDKFVLASCIAWPAITEVHFNVGALASVIGFDA